MIVLLECQPAGMSMYFFTPADSVPGLVRSIDELEASINLKRIVTPRIPVVFSVFVPLMAADVDNQ